MRLVFKKEEKVMECFVINRKIQGQIHKKDSALIVYINIYKYTNLFWLHSSSWNTSVRIGFSFGSQKTKILNNSDI